LEYDPKYAEGYYFRGLAYYNKGDIKQAVLDFNAAREINPTYANQYYDKFSTIESGQVNSSIQNSESTQDIDRKSLVDIYLENEKEQEEQSYRNKMIDLQKQQLEIMRNQGNGNNSYNTNCYVNGSNINCTSN